MSVINQVGNALSGSTGTGAFVGANTPTLITPVIGAASATSIAFTSTSGVIGTTTNDSAAAGSVGELISSVIVQGSAVSMDGSPDNVTSISLTAGDWDVWGNINFSGGAGTVVTSLLGAINTTSGAFPGNALISTVSISVAGATVFATVSPTVIPVMQRISVATTTTVYLVAQANFTVSTATAFGGIYARRRR